MSNMFTEYVHMRMYVYIGYSTPYIAFDTCGEVILRKIVYCNKYQGLQVSIFSFGGECVSVIIQGVNTI